MKREWVDQQKSLVVAVAGVKAMDVDLSRIQEGCEVELRPEPTNPYDTYAIQVVGWYGMARNTEGHLLGYIPREWAAVLSADEWTAKVYAVLSFEGRRSGLRLLLRRVQESDQDPRASAVPTRYVR